MLLTSSNLPNTILRWVANEAGRYLSGLCPRDLAYGGESLVLEFSTSKCYTGGSSKGRKTVSLCDIFGNPSSGNGSQLVTFERKDDVAYVPFPPSPTYPFATEAGIVLNAETVIIFSRDRPMRVFKRSGVITNSVAPDYPTVRERIIEDVKRGRLPESASKLADLPSLFDSKPAWKNVEDIYAKHGGMPPEIVTAFFPEKTGDKISLDYVTVRQQMLKDIEAGVLPPAFRLLANSPVLFHSNPYDDLVRSIYADAAASVPKVIEAAFSS